VAKNKSLFSSLTHALTMTHLIGSSLAPSAVGGQTGSQLRVGTDGALKSLGFNSKDVATGIQFGSPSSSRVPSASGSNEWNKLLKQTISSGVAGAGGGGAFGLLGSVTGVGGLISGFLSLFGGGKSAPPPLTTFQLPQTQQQSISIGSSGQSGTALIYQSTQIAQAVKQALLNSSSLNDVIAEI
jgi:hypothetical protein